MSAMIDPRVLLQAFYLTASAAILMVYLTPALNKRFLAYGARSAAEPPSNKEEFGISPESQTKTTWIGRLLDKVADLKVPHKWFIHFYVVSIASSAFWAHQVITSGTLYCFLASFTPDSCDPDPFIQIVGCWALLAVQGMRRLYESLRQPHGSSTMWVGHYAVGIAFYLATGVAVFIEGLPALKALHALGNGCDYTYQESSNSLAVLPDILAYGVFLGGSMNQHSLHRHLATLKKYTIPTHAAFQWIIAPHYMLECLLYLGLTILSRPTGYYLNHTMATALVFVVVNLGISANETKKWMKAKFGESSVAEKWRMLPGIW